MASVDLRRLTKRYGAVAAVDDVSLRIDHGQLVCLLGPSGCGKTTTLRLIAGFLEPSDGEVHVGNRVVSSKARTLPPEQRNMSMIFQSYALWPHMTVALIVFSVDAGACVESWMSCWRIATDAFWPAASFAPVTRKVLPA